MINEQGGVNGRKINLISLDDGYSPPRTVEQIRRLVEQDEVLAIFQSLGTPTNTAIQKYLNAQESAAAVRQRPVRPSGAIRKNFPWTMGWQPSYHAEAAIYAKYMLQNKPEAKIAVLYQNDDYGKDYLREPARWARRQGVKLIVKEVSYEVTDPSIDSQIVTLQGSGADTFFIFATPKFAAQAIRKTLSTSAGTPLHVREQRLAVGRLGAAAGRAGKVRSG